MGTFGVDEAFKDIGAVESFCQVLGVCGSRQTTPRTTRNYGHTVLWGSGGIGVIRPHCRVALRACAGGCSEPVGLDLRRAAPMSGNIEVEFQGEEEGTLRRLGIRHAWTDWRNGQRDAGRHKRGTFASGHA